MCIISRRRRLVMLTEQNCYYYYILTRHKDVVFKQFYTIKCTHSCTFLHVKIPYVLFSSFEGVSSKTLEVYVFVFSHCGSYKTLTNVKYISDLIGVNADMQRNPKV